MGKVMVGSRHAEFKAEIIARMLSRRMMPIEITDNEWRPNCFFCSEPVTTRTCYVFHNESGDKRYAESDRIQDTFYVHTSCHDRGLLDATSPVPEELVAR